MNTFNAKLGDLQRMPDTVMLRFEVIVDMPSRAMHTRFHCDGWLNEGLREHLPHCTECRLILAKDLRDFAAQIEAMRHE